MRCVNLQGTLIVVNSEKFVFDLHQLSEKLDGKI